MSSIKDRLSAGLRRTRERLSLSSLEAAVPDWDALEESLLLADVGVSATQQILDGVRRRPGDAAAGLREEVLEILGDVRPPGDDSEVREPHVTMLVGVNGVGKTTTAAKMARRAVAGGKSTLLVAADTFRAAAQEQLATWAERLGVEVIEGEQGRDPASVVHEGLQTALSRKVQAVFIDTAGRLHTKRPLMDELAKVERVAGRVVPDAPHETLLVMDATVGGNGLIQAKQFAECLDLTGIVLTKLDGTAKGGVVLAIARELNLGIRYTGIGESADDLVAFSLEDFVEALLSN